MTGAITVFFCLTCDDQPPWKSDTEVICPSCGSIESVTEANRFGNMETGGHRA
jgi:Zn finger protein HypA/HybF involved in hydrogenase expression